MRIIACINQKGGVGKTTICANLAYAFSQQKQRVLAIDLDPQGQLGQSLGQMSPKLSGIDEVLYGTSEVENVAIDIEDNLKLIPAGKQLSKLETVAMGKGKGMLLKRALRHQVEDTDIVMLDCPPSSGFLVVNALAAASELIIPVTPDYLGMAGVSHLMNTIKNFEKVLGAFRYKWIVISREHKRKLTEEVKSKLEHYFPDSLVPVSIAERATVAESPSHGLPVMKYSPQSRSSKEFKQIASLILDGKRHE